MKVLSTFIEWFKRKFVYDEIQDIRDFNKKFRLPLHDEPGHMTKWRLQERIAFMKEELLEFSEAAAIQDLSGQADALIDLVYVAKGTAVMLGLPWEELWLDVHRANMAKELREAHKGQAHKLGVFKPKGWIPPMTDEVLGHSGYVRAEWMHEEFNQIDEGKCRVH